MTFVHDKNIPAPQLLHDVMRKVNALGHEPRVIIELDKMVYVPGLKSKFEVWDRIRTASLEHKATDSTVSPPIDGEPSVDPNSGSTGTDSERFEYIKCAFFTWVTYYKLPMQAYYLFLAMANHETGFGTLGKGVPGKGSFIVGYGCPASCDPGYSGIDRQAKYSAKRYAEAMKSRMGNSKLTQGDINYFHDGGDKGKAYTWSADGPNWKKRVYDYYSALNQSADKWKCKQGVGFANKAPVANTEASDDIYTIHDQALEQLDSTPASVAAASQLLASTTSNPNGVTFPIEGISFGSGAKVSSHHKKQPGGRSGHGGTDIVHTTQGKVNGMWVVAAWGGKVQRSYYSTSFGNCVMINHPNGYTTVYAHMQNGTRQVSTGATVKAGQRLGKVGNTGNSYGAHLHFELWKGKWIYGGSGNMNPYPVLTGDQKINGASGLSESSDTIEPVKMDVVENVKYSKCFDSSGKLSADWHGKENVKHFSSSKTGEKYVGFTKNIKKGELKDFGYSHNFSADGYWEYAFFCNLQAGDSVKVTYDGMQVMLYDSKDNTKSKATYEVPIYGKFSEGSNTGANSHELTFLLDNVSGKAEFGIKCFKVVEVETSGGYQYLDEGIISRKRDVWMETGSFTYDTTYTIEQDIMSWDVNSHFDARVGTATFTLDNRHGIYSPTYARTTDFPDNLREADMSYYENGALRHVISEATPVRIYAGYGENLVRVFTGKIKGEIEEDSSERTITISCVDMYDTFEEHVFDRILTFPRREEISAKDATDEDLEMWVKSSIVHNIVNEVGMIGWRLHEDDLQYPDVVLEETYYIDIDKGGKKAVVWDPKVKTYISKKIKTVKDAYGYKNPYVQAIDFSEGTRAADAIDELIGEIMFRAYCDRYGTFRLENIRNISTANPKWEFIDGENLHSLTTAIDHSRIRNHLLISGSGGQIEHYVDKDLLIATKGNMRTAKIAADWIDETDGASSRGVKDDVANRLFFDMKRQARTFSVAVKGNPMIEVLDAVYVYDRNTSNQGYYVVKGNKLSGTKEGMVNTLELTWAELDYDYQELAKDFIIPRAKPAIEAAAGTTEPVTPAANEKRQKAANYAKSYIGKLKYLWGGKNIPSGKGDCSGFTNFILKKVDYDIGHGTFTQISKGTKISSSQAKVGDIVFFQGTVSGRAKGQPSHVGIITKPGYCVSLAGSGCKEHGYLKSTDSYWGPKLLQINRIFNP